MHDKIMCTYHNRTTSLASSAAISQTFDSVDPKSSLLLHERKRALCSSPLLVSLYHQSLDE